MTDPIPFNGLANTTALSKNDASAEEILAFERLLSNLSARFTNLPGEQIEFEIQTALEQLREFLESVQKH